MNKLLQTLNAMAAISVVVILGAGRMGRWSLGNPTYKQTHRTAT